MFFQTLAHGASFIGKKMPSHGNGCALWDEYHVEKHRIEYPNRVPHAAPAVPRWLIKIRLISMMMIADIDDDLIRKEFLFENDIGMVKRR